MQNSTYIQKLEDVHTPLEEFSRLWKKTPRPVGSGEAFGHRNSLSQALQRVLRIEIWRLGLTSGKRPLSMLVVMMRFYITRTENKYLLLNESQIIKTCTHLVSVLYEMSSKELPGVKSSMTAYMSKCISRSNSSDVPQSTAEAWFEMSMTQDGRDSYFRTRHRILLRGNNVLIFYNK